LLRPRVFAPILLALGALLSVWYAGFRLGGNDEGALLTAAGKILRGGVFYRDIDAYPFPGAHYLLAAAMAAFGEHLGVARALATAVFCALLLVLYAASLLLLDRRRAALFALSLLCFKFLAWPAFTAFFYWDLALLGACLAILLKLWRPVATGPLWSAVMGACVGLAFVAKQSMGIYLGGALLVLAALEGPLLGAARPLRARVGEIGGMALGFAAAVVPMLAYFASQGLLGRMFHSGLVRPFTDYVSTSGISFLAPLRWWEFGVLQGTAGFSYFPESYWTLLRRGALWGDAAYPAYWAAGELLLRSIYTSIPVAFVGAGLVWATARRRAALPGNSRITSFAFLTLAATLTVFPRADFAHLMGVYPLVLLLLFALVRLGSEPLPTSGWIRRLPWLEGAAVAAALVLCAVLVVAHHAGMTAELRLARAELRVHPQDAFVESVVRYVEDEVPEGAGIFVYGHEAQYYFLTGRYSSWPFSQLYPGQDGSDGGAALVAGLERAPPELVIQGFVHFPGVPGLPDQAPALDAFLRDEFEPDPTVFERHPPRSGPAPPPHRLVLLRRRSGGA
jgi:hypothetical protein